MKKIQTRATTIRKTAKNKVKSEKSTSVNELYDFSLQKDYDSDNKSDLELVNQDDNESNKSDSDFVFIRDESDSESDLELIDERNGAKNEGCDVMKSQNFNVLRNGLEMILTDSKKDNAPLIKVTVESLDGELSGLEACKVTVNSLGDELNDLEPCEVASILTTFLVNGSPRDMTSLSYEHCGKKKSFGFKSRVLNLPQPEMTTSKKKTKKTKKQRKRKKKRKNDIAFIESPCSSSLPPSPLPSSESNVFEIENIIKKTRYRSLVKWKNFGEGYNSWVNNKDIVDNTWIKK